MDRIAGTARHPAGEEIVVPHRLVVRESTGQGR